LQIDTGSSCNILNYKDFIDLDKPNLGNNLTRLKQFDANWRKIEENWTFWFTRLVITVIYLVRPLFNSVFLPIKGSGLT